MSILNFSNFVAVIAIAHFVIQSIAQESPKQNRKLCGDCKTPHLFSKFLSRREFALSVQARIKPQTTVSPNYLLDVGVPCTPAEDSTPPSACKARINQTIVHAKLWIVFFSLLEFIAYERLCGQQSNKSSEAIGNTQKFACCRCLCDDFCVCHSEEQHRCDVGIKAKPYFCYTGFPRSLRSLGMTYGRFGICLSVCHCEKQRMLRRVESGSRITLLLNQPNLGSKFQ